MPSPLPIAATIAATQIAAASATLVGSVNPQGQTPTQAYFVYGPTSAYGSSTSTQTIPVSGTPITFQATLAGLSGQTVYFAAVATGPGGTVTATGLSFVPIAPATAAPPNIQATAAVTAPHWAFPIVLRGSLGVQVNEQGTLDELQSNVRMIASAGRGTIPELPAFGLPDPTFSTAPPDMGSIIAAIRALEPRVDETAIVQAADGTNANWTAALIGSLATTER